MAVGPPSSELGCSLQPGVVAESWVEVDWAGHSWQLNFDELLSSCILVSDKMICWFSAPGCVPE